MADMDPRKLKVNELKEQLQLAGLPTTGKKEDLVARLLEHQSKDVDDVSAVVAPPTGSGDQFDWENEEVALPPSETTTNDADAKAPAATAAPTSTAATAPATSAAAPAGAASTPAEATASSPATAATTTTTTAAPAAASSTASAKTAQQEALMAEYEKRKNRAARFGIPLTEQDKALERAARFGAPVTTSTTTTTSPSPAKPAAATTGPARGGKVDPIKNIQLSQDVLNKRAERFGIQPKASTTTTTTSTTTATSGGNKSSLYKLDEAEEEKKRKRAAKFGVPAAEDASKKP
ncbi:hypothetical protein BGZ73_007982 [Actinomortierella ambigua]|nr:hypothetical protein BGZ73_007982 [Actinomortierella ambigua]